MKRVRWGLHIATLIGLAVLIALGTWQLQRLAWKEALIASIETRMKSAPEMPGRLTSENSTSAIEGVRFHGENSAASDLSTATTRLRGPSNRYLRMLAGSNRRAHASCSTASTSHKAARTDGCTTMTSLSGGRTGVHHDGLLEGLELRSQVLAIKSRLL